MASTRRVRGERGVVYSCCWYIDDAGEEYIENRVSRRGVIEITSSYRCGRDGWRCQDGVAAGVAGICWEIGEI